MDQHTKIRRPSPVVVIRNSVQTKISESRQLAERIKLFQQSGGKIQEIETGISVLSKQGRTVREADGFRLRAKRGGIK